MKNWLKIRANQFGIYAAIQYWFLVLFVIFFGGAAAESKSNGSEILIFISAVILFILSLPAIIPPAILWSPFFFLGDNQNFFYGVVSMSIFTVSYQWFTIGKKIYEYFNPAAAPKTILKLGDD